MGGILKKLLHEAKKTKIKIISKNYSYKLSTTKSYHLKQHKHKSIIHSFSFFSFFFLFCVLLYLYFMIFFLTMWNWQHFWFYVSSIIFLSLFCVRINSLTSCWNWHFYKIPLEFLWQKTFKPLFCFCFIFVFVFLLFLFVLDWRIFFTLMIKIVIAVNITQYEIFSSISYFVWISYCILYRVITIPSPHKVWYELIIFIFTFLFFHSSTRLFRLFLGHTKTTRNRRHIVLRVRMER